MPTSAIETTVVEIKEYTTATVRCSARLAARMHADGHVTVAPLAEADRYEIRARHKVGILRHDDLEIRIQPKLPIARLLHLAAVGADPTAWTDVDALLDEAEDPLSAIAHALTHHAQRALRPSPIQGYVTREEAERRVRGRIVFERQLSRRAGVALPIEVRYDDYELGIPENRVLKSAIGLVEGLTTDPSLRRRLRHLRGMLDGVDAWPRGRPIPTFRFGRLNQRYRPALALAKLLLERRSLEYSDRERHGTAFLFDMNRVFERYLESTLTAALMARGGKVRAQHRVHLDTDQTLLMKPDLSWWSGDRCVAAIDAKYKLTASDDHPNADAYQMLAYCVRLGLRRGHLVYADLDGTAPRVSRIREAGVELVVTSIDLQGSIADLHASIDTLATEIARG